MTDTKNIRPRGRPRRFDPEEAIAVAQQLFHGRGYDAVSVADITTALGINPPSFYAAFGSKMGLYARVLDRYTATEAIPLAELLRADEPVAACLTAVLEDAARRYAGNPDATGCMVVEGVRSDDPDARAAACVLQRGAEEAILDYVAARHPDKASEVADFVGATMTGMSAKARAGLSLDRLMAIARIAGQAVAQTIDG
ncbi:TetR/AcrR family transcriptional regulator [Rhizobium sp. 'Codium 1']|uniref:TetR/AcrR family transcriptional regulator n=1 Tax=Rhizobium sp. 'Codium 1' TaxID=2940484 RepID=UPI001E4317F0|nr:TetR/AcrR family transcriptional regulator [Rhizobium sp. 'Codium 1']MCC8934628.1 TetR/AcrR family transcriptional regulator [Rhizobium sp. 'Codium 1']